MKPRLLHFLACPLDGGPLDLMIWEANDTALSAADLERARAAGIDPAELEREIMTGVLVNPRRRTFYPIHAGVPRLLTFSTGVCAEFVRTHGARLAAELPGFSPPHERAMPGEEDVLRTFSAEWLNYDWDGKAYWNLEPEAWLRCMRFMLDLERRPIRNQRVLEVGIGIGGVADAHASREGAEVVGMDLGYATDAAFKNFGRNPFLHIVQASVFAPPLKPAQFDLVYSFGVIHHTFSTKQAFDRLAWLPRRGGRLYVWVYSPFDEERTLKRRILMKMENVIRPIAWRLPERAQAVVLAPLVPLYIAHQRWQAFRSGAGQITYGWREAMHAARDRFTPRYVHRHTDEEVLGWFKDAGYGALEVASQRERPDWVPIAFTASAGIDGVRG